MTGRALCTLVTGLALMGCGGGGSGVELPMKLNTRTAAITLPEVKRFAPAPVRTAPVSNADLAQDFMDLSFELESGRTIDTFTRFEGPITVTLTGRAPEDLVRDLDELLIRLRQEAGIDIGRDRQADNQIVINAIPRAQVRRFLPDAACFVIPNVSSFAEFRRARRNGLTDWTRLNGRRTMAVFLPNDVAPQEMRDCLHEEIAQALGPVNDLYRLPGSVFNDDNIHTVLTDYDMLILRATYHPNLRNGMSRNAVRARLPGIFAALNPRGRTIPPRGTSRTPRAWTQAVQSALGPGTSPQGRRAAARTALQIAQDAGWQDNRRGFAHYILGRLTAESDPTTARQAFVAADRVFASSKGTDPHRAYTAAQLAAIDLQGGAPGQALSRLEPAIATAKAHQNAALVSTLLLLKAQALELQSRPQAATRARLDSLGWARYGFGSAGAVLSKAQEVATLRPDDGS